MERTINILKKDAERISKQCKERGVDFQKEINGKSICGLVTEVSDFNLLFDKKIRTCEFQGEPIVILEDYKLNEGYGTTFRRYFECKKSPTKQIYNEQGNNITSLIDFMDIMIINRHYAQAYHFLNKKEVKEELSKERIEKYESMLKLKITERKRRNNLI